MSEERRILNETKIPENYSRILSEQCAIDISTNHTDKIAVVLFDSVTKILNSLKSKDKPAVFEFRDNDNSLIAAAIVSYQEVEGEDPDNWSYEWTFEEADIPETTVKTNLNHAQNIAWVISVAGELYHFGFGHESYIEVMFNTLLRCIKKYLDDNMSNKEVSVSLDDVFIAKGIIEDGQPVKSLEVIGKTKSEIKGIEEGK